MSVQIYFEFSGPRILIGAIKLQKSQDFLGIEFKKVK